MAAHVALNHLLSPSGIQQAQDLSSWWCHASEIHTVDKKAQPLAGAVAGAGAGGGLLQS